jgi:hypothetical protein
MDGRATAAYRSSMDSVALRFRAVSLIAAYAVALQALLSAFGPVASVASAEPFAILCSGLQAGSAGHPANPDVPCAEICVALGHGNASPLPPDVVVAIASPDVALGLAPAERWVTPLPASRGPQAPRGPPLA